MDVSLQLLGRPTVSYDGHAIEPRASRVSALLLYLASAPGWVPRDDLLFLLWPDTPESSARNNLRQVLHRAGRVEYAEGVERETTRVRWDVPTDVDRFRAAVERGASDEVVDAYGGELLEGFRIADAPEFLSWLELEREDLRTVWRGACLEHARALRSSGDASSAATLLERARSHDPLDEEVFRAWMRALADAGRRAEAIAGYEAFHARLEDELGIEPEPSTEQLVDALRTLDQPAPSGTPHAVSNAGGVRWQAPPLPHPRSPFVGRRTDLARLATSVLDEGHRLVSVVAAGGMGKTRLALELARTLAPRFGDGVAFASFVDVERPEEMFATVADALGLTASHSPRDAVVGHLADRRMLLVLDNLEHLTDDLSLVSDVLARCPELRIVTTSRQRLELAGEWIYDLGGLGLGDDGLGDAARLFKVAAGRVRDRQAAEGLDPSTVAEICRLVQGMPLAIELSAAWLRVLEPPEILEELRRDSALLRSDETDVDDRHRSIDAVFDTTWRQLTSTEREGWARLSVLEGDFDRAAAAAVADVGTPLLLALTNKAVVRRDGPRFDFHPLARRFGRARASSIDVLEPTRRRIAEHFLDWFADLAPSFRGPEHLDAFAAVNRDAANLRAAWQYATDFALCTRLADAGTDLMIYFETFGRQPEFVPLVNATVSALGGDDPLVGDDPERLRAIARVYPWATDQPGGYRDRTHATVPVLERIGDTRGLAYAHLYRAEGGFDGGPATTLRETVATGIACFERIGDDHGIGRMERLLGWPLALTGHYDEARALLERAARRFSRAGDARLEAGCYRDIAPIHIMLGEFDEAEALLERTANYEREAGIWDTETDLLATRQWLAIEKGEYDEAERVQDAYFASIERVGKDVTDLRTYLRAGLDYVRGRYPEARAGAELRLAKFREQGVTTVSRILLDLWLARIALRTERSSDALAYLRDAFEQSLAMRSPRFLADTAVAVAEWQARSGDLSAASRLLAAARSGERLEHRVQLEVDRVLELGVEDADALDARSVELESLLSDVLGVAPNKNDEGELRDDGEDWQRSES